MSDLAFAAALFTPLFAGLVLHGLCIRNGWLGALTIPIDRGAEFRGRRLFGANKTYRGIAAVAAGSAAGYALQSFWPSLQPPPLRALATPVVTVFGFAVGAAAMIAELPNSFLKRQLGIEAGAPGRGWGAPLLYVLDQVDFLLGAWPVACLYVRPTNGRVLWSLVFAVTAHQTISLLGALLGMRASAR